MSSIVVHNFNTPNGVKVHIALEELGLGYETRVVDIGADEQFAPAFLAISPNNKIPALEDADGPEGKPVAIFESGAILLYLAEKTGRLLSSESRTRLAELQWLFWQVAGFGPMLGQAHHFLQYAPEKVPYGIRRYSQEAARLYRVLDKRLSESAYLGGEHYSIADIAVWPWARWPERQGVEETGPHYQRWFAAVAERPAVVRGQEVLAAAVERAKS